MICSVIIAPVCVPRLPTPLLRVVSVNEYVVYGCVEATCVILKPLPLVVVISLDEARLVIKAPSAIKLAIPLPEPLPEINVFLSPRHPAQVVCHLVLLVLLCKYFPHTILK